MSTKKKKKLEAAKQKAREHKESEQQEKADEPQQDVHWLKYSFSKRHKRTFVLIAIFIILGLFSSLMYYRTGGEYNDVSDTFLNTYINK